MPAWVVAKANQYARDHGMTPFSIYQGQWNVMKRSFEREIIPMAREEGAYFSFRLILSSIWLLSLHFFSSSIRIYFVHLFSCVSLFVALLIRFAFLVFSRYSTDELLRPVSPIYTRSSSGLALAPWDVLAAGKIRTDAEEAARRETGENGRVVFNPDWERTPDERKVCAALEVVAGQVGATSIQAGTSRTVFSSFCCASPLTPV